MIAFKGIEISKKSFLFSEEASGSSLWNVDLMSTVGHASTSPRESVIKQPPPVEPEDKEIWWQCYKYVPKSSIEHDKLTGKSFCGIQCQANYFNKNVQTWSNSDCKQYFVKKSGIIVNHSWYWSTEWSSKAYELLNRSESEGDKEFNFTDDLKVEELIDENLNYEIDLL